MKKVSARISSQTRWLAVLGIVFVVVTFAMLLRESFSTRRAVAAIVIRVDEVLPSPHGYLVSLKIGNTGEGTAAALVVEGVLTRNGLSVETSLVTVDYVAARSERDATLLFSNDPRDGTYRQAQGLHRAVKRCASLEVVLDAGEWRAGRRAPEYVRCPPHPVDRRAICRLRGSVPRGLGYIRRSRGRPTPRARAR